eukprot:UN23843
MAAKLLNMDAKRKGIPKSAWPNPRLTDNDSFVNTETNEQFDCFSNNQNQSNNLNDIMQIEELDAPQRNNNFGAPSNCTALATMNGGSSSLIQRTVALYKAHEQQANVVSKLLQSQQQTVALQNSTQSQLQEFQNIFCKSMGMMAQKVNNIETKYAELKQENQDMQERHQDMQQRLVMMENRLEMAKPTQPAQIQRLTNNQNNRIPPSNHPPPSSAQSFNNRRFG